MTELCSIWPILRSRVGSFLLASVILMSTGIWTVPAQSQQDAEKGQLIFNHANGLMEKGEFKGAVEKYTEAIAILPDWYLPHMNRAIAYLSLLKLSEAEADADRAIGLIRPETRSAKPHFGTLYQIKGTVDQHRGDLEAALANFSKAVEAQPSNPNLHNSRANALRLLERNEEALAGYDRAIELGPNEPQFHVNRAGIYERLSRVDAALRDINEALRLDKTFGLAYYTRATIKMRSKAFAEALADFNEAIRLESNKATYFHARGLLHHSMKNFDLAAKDHTQAIAIEPTNTFAFADRAIAHAALENRKAAIEDLKVANGLSPRSPALRYNLSYFLFQDGRYEEAVQAATEALALAPEWAAPYIVRSNSYVRLKMPAKAQADRNKIKGLSANGRPDNDRYFVLGLEVRLEEQEKP